VVTKCLEEVEAGPEASEERLLPWDWGLRSLEEPLSLSFPHPPSHAKSCRPGTQASEGVLLLVLVFLRVWKSPETRTNYWPSKGASPFFLL
jgi:hypothetical protein